MEPLRVDHALKDLRRLLGRIAGPDVDFVVDVEDGLPPVRFDRGAFRSVVVELVRTASAAIVDHGRIAVRASSGPGSVVLTVADSGPGRPDDELPGPFELFHASKSRGAGAVAGLAAVSDILASSGAHVEVTATPGGGSRFSIYLPLWA
jgi:two-component system, cell cycle sensor histidine kinase and response regulator CckA